MNRVVFLFKRQRANIKQTLRIANDGEQLYRTLHFNSLIFLLFEDTNIHTEDLIVIVYNLSLVVLSVCPNQISTL